MKTFKKFFSSFKNSVISIVCAVAVLAAIGTGIALAAGAGKSDTVMDRKTAFGYALADAGVSEQQVTVTKQKLEKEKGEQYYEFDFFSKEYEYSYEIDAYTGTVRSVSVEALFGKPSEGQGSMAAGNGQGTGQPGAGQQNAEGSGQGSSQPGSEGSGQGSSQAGAEGPGQGSSQPGSVDLDTAKSTALTDAGVSAADAVFTKSKLDWDDGAQVYDIEFYAGGAEYDYEIDASTGAILEKGMKLLGDTYAAAHGQGSSGGAGAGSSYIGEEQARSIAASHAGFEVADVVFTKTKLEQHDGYAKYEVEFRKDRMEYDYEIDALTGSILEHGSEYD